jgi:hypothetical protein
LVGADVWFDEWEIRAGDSILGSVEEALEKFDTFVLVWSEHAAASSWVRAELEVALTRRIEDGEIRVITVRLDDTPLPAFLRPLKYLKIEDGVPSVVDAIMGFTNDRDRLRAIQHVLDEAGIYARDVPGIGLMVACPNCGADPDKISGRTYTDERHDATYITVSCEECGWSDGGEI